VSPAQRLKTGYDGAGMSLEMLIIAAVRLLGALPVLRWAFVGGLIAVLVDQSDLFLMNLIDLGGVSDYQTFDKYLDQAYQVTFLSVALRWRAPWRPVAVGLFAYRFVGFLLFEVTQTRSLLLLFPNLFEFWFLFIAGLKFFDLEERISTRAVLGVTSALLALKLFQEYAVHHARWLDDFTAVEAVEAIWRWLTGPLG